jgi:LysR family cys regulon transcriptional activator
VEIFVRRGKRLVALTEPGKLVVKVVERILNETENLRQVGREFRDQESGSLVIATTHTQARYALPRVVTGFKRRYPKVHLSLQQGSPPQLAEMVIGGDADIAIATESLDHCPPRLALEDLTPYPIITYDAAFTGRSHIDAAFAARELKPDIVLSAIDADVIKTYVELGMGVGIVATMAFDAKRDRSLRSLDAGHLFASNTTRVAVRRGGLLRGYAYAFIELFAPHLSRQVIEKALAGEGELYEL